MSNVLEYSVKVNSDLISDADYDPYKNELRINFKSGNSYIYKHVGKVIFDRFCAAKSKGKFFNDRIKPKYEHVKAKTFRG